MAEAQMTTPTVINPASNTALDEVHLASLEEADAAIEQAHEASRWLRR